MHATICDGDQAPQETPAARTEHHVLRRKAWRKCGCIAPQPAHRARASTSPPAPHKIETAAHLGLAILGKRHLHRHGRDYRRGCGLCLGSGSITWSFGLATNDQLGTPAHHIVTDQSDRNRWQPRADVASQIANLTQSRSM